MPEKKKRAGKPAKQNKRKKQKKQAEQKKQKNAAKAKRSLFNRWLFKLVAAAAVVGCAMLVITTENDCSEKEREMATLQARIDAFNMENEELRRTLDSDDLSAYIERIALEERGYAYPDERRFYDTSRD